MKVIKHLYNLLKENVAESKQSLTEKGYTCLKAVEDPFEK